MRVGVGLVAGGRRREIVAVLLEPVVDAQGIRGGVQIDVVARGGIVPDVESVRVADLIEGRVGGERLRRRWILQREHDAVRNAAPRVAPDDAGAAPDPSPGKSHYAVGYGVVVDLDAPRAPRPGG